MIFTKSNNRNKNIWKYNKRSSLVSKGLFIHVYYYTFAFNILYFITFSIDIYVYMQMSKFHVVRFNFMFNKQSARGFISGQVGRKFSRQIKLISKTPIAIFIKQFYFWNYCYQCYCFNLDSLCGEHYKEIYKIVKFNCADLIKQNGKPAIWGRF